MIIGVLQEPAFETRVSLLPEAVASLSKKGIKVIIESGAGLKASADDDDYVKAGAQVKTRNETIQASDILLSIQTPAPAETPGLSSKILASVYQPLFSPALMKEWAAAKITSFSLDMLPRTTRAQSMDVLSSQANIAGYKAVLHAANILPHYFPMFMTAAGSIPPAKV